MFRKTGDVGELLALAQRSCIAQKLRIVAFAVGICLLTLAPGLAWAQLTPTSISYRALSGATLASSGSSAEASGEPVALGSVHAPSTPLTPPGGAAYIEKKNPPQVTTDWNHLGKDSLQFMLVMNTFRIATEPNTRAALKNPLFSGYVKAIGNMHGWDDGDEFYVNYVGHPMQGAVSSFIWTNNDRRFNREHIGWNSRYVKSKLRAMAYSFVLSELFELGPISEASIGQIQRYHPATGFVDHVVTPTLGVIWSVGEDAIDNSVVRYIENRTDSTVLKVLTRSVLNPAHSFANLMSRKYPWYRTNRPGASASDSAIYYRPTPTTPVTPPPGVAPFQFKIHFETRTYFGQNAPDPCVGGGAELGFRIANNWQLLGEVTGCKQTRMLPNWSGDTLTYVTGPQWTSRLSSRWGTHARILLGGNKVSQEQFFPELKRKLEQERKNKNVFPPLGQQYTRSFDNNSFAIVTGTGFEYKMNRALLFRSSLDYLHTWNRDINDSNYRNSLRFSSGFVLTMGNW